MEKPDPSNRRYVYYIHPQFQRWFISAVLRAGVLISMGALFIHGLFMFRVRSAAQELELPPQNFFFLYLERQNLLIALYFLVVAVLFLVGFSIWALIVSHRIVGPLRKLENEMKRVAGGGEAQSIRFRDKDFFPELAQAYNALTESYKNPRKSNPVVSLEDLTKMRAGFQKNKAS